MKIELDDEFMDDAIRGRLADLYHELGKSSIPIFNFDDPEDEARKLRKLRKAVKKVHNWFALEEDRL